MRAVTLEQVVVPKGIHKAHSHSGNTMSLKYHILFVSQLIQ